MIQEDTIKLLRECNAGVKMGVSSIAEIVDKTQNKQFRELLTKAQTEHEKLGNETRELLNKYHDEGKEPNPLAKGMSWLKTNVMLSVEDSDQTAADLMTDGCNMGVKSLSKYLNQYKAAEEQAKDIAKELIKLEDNLAKDIRCYL